VNRREFLCMVAFGTTLIPGAAAASPHRDPLDAAVDFAAVTYLASESAEVRQVFARVSRWADAEAATRFGVYVLHQAGSNLPEGEFYQTEPVDLVIPPDRLAPPAMARRWQTIVGAAAFTTDVVILVVQRETLLWDLRIRGSIEANVPDIAIDLAADLVERDWSLPLVDLVPAPDEGPGGIDFDSLVTPDGMVNDDGTPLASPEAAGSR
jgi:hypothetical protein